MFGRREADHVIIAGWILVICGVVPMSVLLSRDLLLRHFLGRAIRMRIERIRCLKCRYPLVGQRVENDVVTCSECGHHMTLSEIGVDSPEDLIPAPAGDDSICPDCAGPLDRNRGQCGECGWSRLPVAT